MSEFVATFLSILAVAAILIALNAFIGIYKNWNTIKAIIPKVVALAKVVGSKMAVADTATVITAKKVRLMVVTYTYGGTHYKAYLPLDRIVSRKYAAVYDGKEEDLHCYPSAKLTLTPKDIGADRIIVRDTMSGEIIQ